MKFARLATVAITAVLLIGLATPAAAKSRSFTDPAKDATGSSAKAIKNLDLRTIDITYTKKKLTVIAGFKKLKKSSWNSASVLVDVDGDGYFDARLDARMKKGKITGDYLAPGSAMPEQITGKRHLGKNGTVTFKIPAKKLALDGATEPTSVAVRVDFTKLNAKRSDALASDGAPNKPGTSPYSPSLLKAVKR